MRFIVLLSVVASLVGTAGSSFACNGQGGGGSGGTTSSSGTSGAASIGAAAGMSSNSLRVSPAMQQAFLQQLANQRFLQQQYQQQLLAQQQFMQEQANLQAIARAEMVQQAREHKIAQRKERAAARLAKQEALKARNLAKRSQLNTQTQLVSNQ